MTKDSYTRFMEIAVKVITLKRLTVFIGLIASLITIYVYLIEVPEPPQLVPQEQQKLLLEIILELLKDSGKNLPNQEELTDKSPDKLIAVLMPQLAENPPDNVQEIREKMPPFNTHFHAINELLHKEHNRIPQNKEVNQEIVLRIKTKAKSGDIQAQLSLGGMYLIGLGIPENRSEAIKWYGKAAKQGNIEAERTLGWLFLVEKASPDKSEVKVKTWYSSLWDTHVKDANISVHAK